MRVEGDFLLYACKKKHHTHTRTEKTSRFELDQSCSSDTFMHKYMCVYMRICGSLSHVINRNCPRSHIVHHMFIASRSKVGGNRISFSPHDLLARCFYGFSNYLSKLWLVLVFTGAAESRECVCAHNKTNTHFPSLDDCCKYLFLHDILCQLVIWFVKKNEFGAIGRPLKSCTIENDDKVHQDWNAKQRSIELLPDGLRSFLWVNYTAKRERISLNLIQNNYLHIFLHAIRVEIRKVLLFHRILSAKAAK